MRVARSMYTLGSRYAVSVGSRYAVAVGSRYAVAVIRQLHHWTLARRDKAPHCAAPLRPGLGQSVRSGSRCRTRHPRRRR